VFSLCTTRFNIQTFYALSTQCIYVSCVDIRTNSDNFVNETESVYRAVRAEYCNTGRFIMFSMITNIYNKKTKGPTLIELFTATGKLMKFFLTTRDFRCVHHGWHGTHRSDIQIVATHASTWVQRYSSLLQWSVLLGQRRHGAMVLRVLCTKYTLHSNHWLTRVIFQRTKRLLPGRPFLTTYTRIAYRQKCEIRWKTTYWEKKKIWVVPSICTRFVNTCPTVFLK